MFRKCIVSLAFFFVSLLAACSGTPVGPGVSPTTAQTTAQQTPIDTIEPSPTHDLLAENAAQVDAIFAKNVKTDEPGGAVIVLLDGMTLYKAAYGVANIDTGKPLTTKSLLHIGSVSKQFTAMGIMMLAEEGKLAYDDPVGKFLPELAHFGDEVTIRRLLTHTSGLPQPSQEELLAKSNRPDNDDELAVLAGIPDLASEPGTQYEYSDAGYEMLASVIERLSGQTYAEFLEKRIFAPLGMTHTFSLPDSERLSDPQLSFSHIQHPGEPLRAIPPDADPLDHLVGSGSVYSSVEDMALYDAALYTDQLVSQSTLAEGMQPGKLKNGNEVPYGFAWELGELQGERFTRHSGRALAFNSNYLRFPERRLSVIVLLNRTYPPMDSKELADEVGMLYLKYRPGVK